MRTLLAVIIALSPLTLFFACSPSSPAPTSPDASADALPDAKIKLSDGSAMDAASDGSPDAGDAGTCVITMSGAATGTYPCNAAIAYSQGGQVSGTWLTVSPTSYVGLSGLSVELSASEGLATGTYDQSSAVEALATYTDPNNGAWVLCWNDPSGCPTNGTFSVDVQSAGTMLTAPNGVTWYGAFGTATATLPAVPGDPYSSGTVVLTIQWVTTEIGDGGPPDGGTDGSTDGGKPGNGCTIDVTGAVTASLGCTLQPVSYVSATNLTNVVIGSKANDAGLTCTIDVEATGPLALQTYSGLTGNVSIAGAGFGTSTAAWQQSYSAADGGPPPVGSFTMTPTTLGVQTTTSTGIQYTGEQGSYGAVLVPVGDGGGANVNLTVNF